MITHRDTSCDNEFITARFLPTTRAATDTPQFMPEECRELMDAIRSQNTSPVVKKRLIARVMLRVGEKTEPLHIAPFSCDGLAAERRVGHIKTEPASAQPSPETGDQGHLRDDMSLLASIYSPPDKISRWYMVYSGVLLTVVSDKFSMST